MPVQTKQASFRKKTLTFKLFVTLLKNRSIKSFWYLGLAPIVCPPFIKLFFALKETSKPYPSWKIYGVDHFIL
ncbi:hypothetical protein Lbir_1741 [Legionella birminghamensis]|uniref:Uncharacterized protein n=1 Tax=Legionella birminghamensis TaxID=28083 RepID=A0A378JVD7_9GAMM|nr:hypothetical protein Lbir_1741 [Legionella birminghamensis]STX60969.1 Uncharacterised protein [Legionella birminghamensis]